MELSGKSSSSEGEKKTEEGRIEKELRDLRDGGWVGG